MPTTLSELARLVGGTVVGDGSLPIATARPLDLAGPGDVTFLESARYLEKFKKSRASAALAASTVTHPSMSLIHVDDPLLAFAAVYAHLNDLPAPEPAGVDPRAIIHASAVIGEGAAIAPLAQIGEGSVLGARCRIGPGAVIGRRCRIGDDVTIHANAVLYERTIVGSRVIIHAGAVIGADGFGYRQRAGRHVKVPQLGHVEIGDDVEIGAGTAIDRATFDATRIGEGTKIDNLVQIGHNCRIGRHNILVGQCGIAGSSSTGDHVIIAGQAGVADNVRIGAKAIIGGHSAVASDVAPGRYYLGVPALEQREFHYQRWCVSRLKDWSADLKAIKARLGLSEGP